MSFPLELFTDGKLEASVSPGSDSSTEEESDCHISSSLKCFGADMGAYHDKIGALMTSPISALRQSLDHVLQYKVNIPDWLLLQKEKQRNNIKTKTTKCVNHVCKCSD